MNQNNRKFNIIAGFFAAIVVILMSCCFYFSINRLTLSTLAISFILGIGIGFLIFIDCVTYPESF